VNRFVIISGCSGGGKSTLLAELARRGHSVVEEPGRRIIDEQAAMDGSALPWIDLCAFARRAVAMALHDRAAAARMPGPVFFDRGLIDAAVALEHAGGLPAVDVLCRVHRYHPLVFLTPPWPEIFVQDDGRRHGMADARAEYRRLVAACRLLGYRPFILPRLPVAARADILLHRLSREDTQ